MLTVGVRPILRISVLREAGAGSGRDSFLGRSLVRGAPRRVGGCLNYESGGCKNGIFCRGLMNCGLRIADCGLGGRESAPGGIGEAATADVAAGGDTRAPGEAESAIGNPQSAMDGLPCVMCAGEVVILETFRNWARCPGCGRIWTVPGRSLRFKVP